MTSDLDFDYLTSLELENILQKTMLRHHLKDRKLMKKILILDNVESFSTKVRTDTIRNKYIEFAKNESKQKVVVCISTEANKTFKECISLKLYTPHFNKKLLDKIIEENMLCITKEQRNYVLSKAKRYKYSVSELLGQLKLIDLKNKIE